MICVSNPITSTVRRYAPQYTTRPAAGAPRSAGLAPLALWVLGTFLQPILAWVSDQLIRSVLARCLDHPLLRLAQTYDPAAVVAACAHYYHAAPTKGAPPTFTVAQLVRAEIVRAWANSCSDGELEWLLASNLLVRHFVGLPLLGPTPDHSTLSRFHDWLTDQAPDALFRDVLAFLDRLDPQDPSHTPQIVDTFALASPAAPALSVGSLLRHLTRRLALAWLAQAPAAVSACAAAARPEWLGAHGCPAHAPARPAAPPGRRDSRQLGGRRPECAPGGASRTLSHYGGHPAAGHRQGHL
jgi:hypothetical protein